MKYIAIIAMVVYTLVVSFYLYSIDVASIIGELPTLGFLSIPYPIILAIVIIYMLRRSYRRGIKDSDRSIIIFMSITLIFVSAALSLYDPKNVSPVAILIGAYFATIGWIFTGYESRNNNKKAHTLNILLQMRNSPEFNKHREIYMDYINPGKSVSYDLISEINDRLKLATPSLNGRPAVDLIRSVRYLCNYYEFICAGYLSGDLDEKLIIRTIRGTVVSFYDEVKQFIDDERRTKDGINYLIFQNIETCSDILRKKGIKLNKGIDRIKK